MAYTPPLPRRWLGHPSVRGPTESIRLLLLTVSTIGLQFCWATEMTYCNPFLLSLGMPKSHLSLVWVAGPLSGLVMQPLVGAWSDGCTGRWGRRRVYMLAGSGLVVGCYLVLGWVEGVVAGLGLGRGGGEEDRRQWAIWLAVVVIYVLDFSINIAQTTCRALVVDTLPVEKQQLGSAWVSRMSGVGHLMVYAIGSLDLNRLLGGFLGDTQFKKVCAIAALAMLITQGVTCWAVKERVLVADPDVKRARGSLSLLPVLRQIYTTTRHLPERIEAICWVQFWSWIGWFPFLFYTSTWIGELYLRHEAPPSTTTRSDSALNDVGRHGSRALIAFSLISFAASIVLPWFIQSPDDDDRPRFTARPPPRLAPFLRDVRAAKPSLLTAWRAGSLLFAAAMVFAPLVHSVRFATLLVALCGIPWAIAGWAPGAFLGVEVNRLSAAMPAHTRVSSVDSLDLDAGLVAGDSPPRVLHLLHHDSSNPALDSTADLSGLYLGILNIYTTIPQFLGTAISWLVFSLLEPGKSAELARQGGPDDRDGAREGVSGIAVCLCIGAVSAVGSAWATRRMERSRG